METKSFELMVGLKVGETVHKSIQIRSGDIGAILDANAEGGSNDYAVGAGAMRRRILSIGDIEGPIALGLFRTLDEADMIIIQHKMDEMDTEMAKRIQAHLNPKPEGDGSGGEADGGS